MRHIQAQKRIEQAQRCVSCKVLWLPRQIARLRALEKYEVQVRLLLFVWDCRNAITVVSAIAGVSLWGFEHSGH